MITVVVAVIEREGRLLICQRRKEDTFPLKWEFPGGKVEAGESPEEALKRELQEELGVTLRRSSEIARVEQTYPQLREPREILFFAADINCAEIMPRVFEQILWVQPKELAGYDFLAANATLVAHLATGKIRPSEILGPE
ncbi:MAG TPA: (deoxy)nucleoside triphosphate pyrophosphohydrolase [Candidatus Dormibacteraeota bacterium]|nr:(deoxy)nucleoside triphosphate pyrophosphohydrolase [Candidatus Dormibacteraeota bacterium]